MRAGLADKKTRYGLPKRVAGLAMPHFARQHEEQIVILKVVEDGRAQDDECAGVGAIGIGVPLRVAGDIHVGHFRQAENARRQNGANPDIGELPGAEANAVERRFNPWPAHLVGDCLHRRMERGDALQMWSSPGHPAPTGKPSDRACSREATDAANYIPGKPGQLR